MSAQAKVARAFLLTSFGALLCVVATSHVAAAWPDPAWTLNTPMTINNLGTPLSNYQVKIDLDGSFPFGAANADGSDLRVATSDGSALLPFWIESWTGSSATSDSDASVVFDFYDGFESPFGDRPLTNAAAPQITPTYDGSGQIVHPGIVYFPDGWHGWEHWLVVTWASGILCGMRG